jgi:hypothetical protein
LHITIEGHYAEIIYLEKKMDYAEVIEVITETKQEEKPHVTL